MSNKPKKIEDLPTKPGRYNLMIEDVLTLIPVFANFDGRQWDLSKIQTYLNMNKQIYYFDNVDNQTP